MRLGGIASQDAPPLWAPLRFLLSAPWFAALAGLLLLWEGPAALESRWTPALLAATHLLTLGFMSMVMLGALLQLLPVVAGAPISRPGLVAAVVHPLLVVGTLLLAGGLWLGEVVGIRLATPALAAGFGLFVALALRALWHAAARAAIGRSIGLALIALAVTVALGLTLTAMLGWGAAIPMVKAVTLHAAWGLVGWTVLLVFVVAQQVVPMFQVTPLYPAPLSKLFAPALLGLLLAWSAASWLEWRGAAGLLGIAVALLVLGFSAVTLGLQLRSRRPAADATTLAWRAGMVCLALAAVVGSAGSFVPGAAAPYAVLVGVLSVIGFALSVINGMLYKIVPFLIWLHLQNTVGGRVPHIKRILPEPPARWHARLHLASIALLCLAAVWPRVFLYPGAVLSALSGAILGGILLRACRWIGWREGQV
jgi:hypothetical protein